MTKISFYAVLVAPVSPLVLFCFAATISPRLSEDVSFTARQVVVKAGHPGYMQGL